MKSKSIELGTRKLSKQNYSWVITIPDVWVRNAGLQQNELVVFLMNEQKDLVIKPHKVYVNE